MEPLQTAQVRRLAVLGLALLGSLSAGCETMNSLTSSFDGPPAGSYTHVVAYWNPEIVHTPDPTHGGMDLPGIAGRVYFADDTPKLGANFSVDNPSQIEFKACGEGAIVVDLYDPNRSEKDSGAAPLGQWRYDSVTLQRLLRKDVIGWGYTLFLPWPDYKPEYTRIQLRLRFEPAKGGMAMYANSQPMTLDNGLNKAPVVTSSDRLLVPANQPAFRNAVLVPEGQQAPPTNPAGKPPVQATSQPLPGEGKQPPPLPIVVIPPGAGN
jgi:hypothetical protein